MEAMTDSLANKFPIERAQVYPLSPFVEVAFSYGLHRRGVDAGRTGDLSVRCLPFIRIDRPANADGSPAIFFDCSP